MTKNRQALFSGLVYNEAGEPVETTYIGSEPHYVILDDDFRRHISAAEVDRQVVERIKQEATTHQDIVSEQMMKILGKDDLFTKAMIDSSISRMDEQVMEMGLPEDARMMLGMMGFRIIVDLHGEVVDIDMPAQELPGEDEW